MFLAFVYVVFERNNIGKERSEVKENQKTSNWHQSKVAIYVGFEGVERSTGSVSKNFV
jgi:hypothetical protein